MLDASAEFIGRLSASPSAMMLAPVLLGLAMAALLALAGLSRGRRAAYRRGRFLSRNEKAFLVALDQALGRGFRAFAQVRLADLVEVEGSVDNAKRRAALNKVFGKSVDFVLCDAASLDPLAAIELDDRSHALSWRQERDAFVNGVFAEIGLPLLRTPARGAYSAAAIRKMLMDAGILESGERPDAGYRGRM